MGLLDGIREILGIRAEADSARGARPDDLFEMSTAYVTMAADLGYEVVGEAALCFANVDSTDFADTVDEVVAILERGREEFGTETRLDVDEHGYHWVIFADEDFEDLITSLHFAADTFVERDYGNRLLAAVFAFEKNDQTDYWIYSFRRGAYYPFAPREDRERDERAEFKLESVLDGELTIESDVGFRYSMWPRSPDVHPWE